MSGTLCFALWFSGHLKDRESMSQLHEAMLEVLKFHRPEETGYLLLPEGHELSNYGQPPTPTLSARHRLAGVLRNLGQLEWAEAEYQAVLADSARVLGEEHLDTLSTRHNLAEVLRERGQLDTAEAEYRAVLAARTRVLGEEHLDTLSTRHNLAEVLRERMP